MVFKHNCLVSNFIVGKSFQNPYYVLEIQTYEQYYSYLLTSIFGFTNSKLKIDSVIYQILKKFLEIIIQFQVFL